MHILHMIDTLQIGGAQKLLVIFGMESKKRGIQTSVVCLDDSREKITALELGKIGIRVTFFPASKLYNLHRIKKLIGYLRSGQFSLIHTHLSYANIIGTLCGRLSRLPVVTSLHSPGSMQPTKNPFREWGEIIALRYGTRRVIAVGDNIAEVYRSRLGGKTIEVIPNPVLPLSPLSSEERQSLRRRLIGDAGNSLVISVCRFTRVKGLPDLVDAFAEVKAKHPDVVLAIVGDGDMRPVVEAQVAKLNLCKSVILPGRRNDVPDWLQASDLFVLSSHMEGVPLSILEAMAAGLPIVATAVGDIPHVVLPGMGILVPPHQPKELASAICHLLDQPELRRSMGEAGRRYVTQNFSVDTWFDCFDNLYKDVLNPKKPVRAALGGVN